MSTSDAVEREFKPDADETEEEPKAATVASGQTATTTDSTPSVAVGGSEDMTGKQRWINGKWTYRYEDNDMFVTYDETGGWQAVPDDEKDFYLQLWQEQIAAEAAQKKGDEIDEDFLAQYNLNYGVQYDYDAMKKEKDEEEEKKKKEAEEEKKRKEEEKKDKKMPRPAGWVDMDEKVNAVYVSNMPTDITMKEFVEIMSKCGVIQDDARTNKPKCKLYLDDDGNPKGDGRCCYAKKESVELALSILDEMDIRGKKISVERAHFELKGEYDPKKKRRRLTNAQKKRFMEQQNRHFEWKPEKPRNYRPISDCTVVIKQLFTIEELNEDASRLFALKEELDKSCSKFGVVKKVVVYDSNPEGVATVTFEKTTESDEAVKMLNGRPVRGRILSAQLWDGKTKYKVQETEEEARKRIEKWEKFVESGGKKGEEVAREEEEGTVSEEVNEAAATPPREEIEHEATPPREETST